MRKKKNRESVHELKLPVHFPNIQALEWFTMKYTKYTFKAIKSRKYFKIVVYMNVLKRDILYYFGVLF